MPFLRKDCYDFKETIEWTEPYLQTLLTSTQAIQLKQKRSQTYDATN